MKKLLLASLILSGCATVQPPISEKVKPDFNSAFITILKGNLSSEEKETPAPLPENKWYFLYSRDRVDYYINKTNVIINSLDFKVSYSLLSDNREFKNFIKTKFNTNSKFNDVYPEFTEQRVNVSCGSAESQVASKKKFNSELEITSYSHQPERKQVWMKNSIDDMVCFAIGSMRF